MPAYRTTDSHPYQRNHMAFPHCYQPVMESIPPQMNMDPSKSPSAYEQPWPYISGHGHGYPTHMQFCCGGHHGFPGHWTYTPAYPHIPTSSPMCFSGGYPTYPDPFHVPYAAPPHYTMELPRYEYDKCMPREYHCCGCPNHPLSHQKEGNGVMIEEHEPDAEKKVNNDISPSQLKNYLYPFGWMPPQYMNNEELKKPDAKEVGDAQEPKVWNGCFPLDINSLANMIQGGNGRKSKNTQIGNGMKEEEDGKTNPSQQSERNRREIPFPVIWIPNYNMQEGERTKDQERTSSPNSVKEVPLALNSAPAVSHPRDDASNRSNVNGNDLNVGGSEVTRKETNEENIPSKQMELQRSEPESQEKRVKDIPVKQIEGDMTGKETQTSVKRQSSSPKKTSKLPPVCLRVDPLPRKKNGNGSSRSPSPAKKGFAESINGTSKSSSASSSMHDKPFEDEKRQHASNEGAELKPKEKTIEVVEMSSGNKDGERRDGSGSHGKTQEDVKLQKDSDTTEDDKPKKRSIKVVEKSSEKKPEDHVNGIQSQVTSYTNSEVHKNSSPLTSMGESRTNGEKTNGNEAEKKVNDMIKEEAAMDAKDAKERKDLSDIEAASLIQAAYRSFQVRKWEPLKKLKQIAEVSKHVTDVRGRIQALEESSNEQIDERERITIGETIMRLLLKLDTIQGLHPSFREMRKSLARELTALQEKLDSVIAEKSQLHMEYPSMGKLMTPPVGECKQELPEEEVSVPEKDSPEGIIQESHGSSEQQAVEIASDMMDEGQDQLSSNNSNPSHDGEKLQSVVHSLPIDDGKWKFSSPTDQVLNEKPKPLPEEMVGRTLNKSREDEASGCDISEAKPKTKPELEGIPNEADELDMKVWEELPRGVIDDLKADDIDFMKDKEHEKIEEQELQISEVTNTSGNDFAQDGEPSKMHEMEELPVGLLDDDTTNLEKHEETGTSAQVLQSEEGECNPALVTQYLAGELPIGLLDEDTTESEKHEETGISVQVLGECNPALITHSLVNDICKEPKLDRLQQQQEEQEENQSNGETDDWVKVEYEQAGPKGDASENAKVESGSKEENDEQSVTTTFTEDEGHAEANEDVRLEVKEVITVTEIPGEKVAVTEPQSEQEIKVDDEKKDVLSEQMSEQRMTSTLSEEIPLPKQDGEMDTNKGLIEENENLRKMIQKLLEAGNEQLTVISNLAGRVKDLEKKLAKKKRIKTIHCRPATSRPSCKKSSNNQLQGKITEVAM